MTQSKYQPAVDLSGATVSLLCTIHCAVTPLLFLTRPLLDGAAPSRIGHAWWGGLDWIFLFLSLGAVWFSAKHTSNRNIRWLLWIFWIVFSVGLLLEMGGLKENKWVMYAGSISLAATHLINFRYCRKCDSEKCDNAP